MYEITTQIKKKCDDGAYLLKCHLHVSDFFIFTIHVLVQVILKWWNTIQFKLYMSIYLTPHANETRPNKPKLCTY